MGGVSFSGVTVPIKDIWSPLAAFSKKQFPAFFLQVKTRPCSLQWFRPLLHAVPSSLRAAGSGWPCGPGSSWSPALGLRTPRVQLPLRPGTGACRTRVHGAKASAGTRPGAWPPAAGRHPHVASRPPSRNVGLGRQCPWRFDLLVWPCGA